MTHIFLDSPYYLLQSLYLQTYHDKKDREQNGLHYYDGQPKNASKVEVARMSSGHPLLENMKSEPALARRGSDS